MIGQYPETREEHQKYVVMCLECGCRHVTLDKCHNRFCKHCRGGKWLEQKRRGEHIINGAKLRLYEQWQMVTLTVPHMQDARIQYKTLMTGFRRLRYRHGWRKRITGGVFGVEVKRARDGDGWHIHLHAIVWGRSISWKWLWAVWRECHPGVPWTKCNGSHCQNIYSHGGALRYVLGYVGKNDLCVVDQIEASTALKGCQMWGVLGKARGILKTYERQRLCCSECQSIRLYPEQLFERMYPHDYLYIMDQRQSRLEANNLKTARASPETSSAL